MIGQASTDRFNVNISFSSNWEHLQNKFVGTGHPDITKWEWAVNQHRDTLASHVGHFDQLALFAVAENESIARTRYNMKEKMLQPCGPPPAVITASGEEEQQQQQQQEQQQQGKEEEEKKEQDSEHQQQNGQQQSHVTQ
eukprot:gb/GECG01006786.1/.p1 GENE.gb/GECG01006786.1/~~gb/GECG01006786.1/.p1  ORF type:complete len:139 (+),score=32.80 gb/GECG01006786.1/:1-417(+)